MKRQLVRPLVALAASWLDDTVPVEQLHGFLIQNLEDFHRRYGTTPPDAEIAGDVALACRAAAEAGLLPAEHEIETALPQPSPPSGEEIRQWVESVPDGKVVTARRLVAGTGRRLDRIETAGPGEWEDFVQRSLEALMRNAEIRRNRCLQPVQPTASSGQQWMEKHDVAILLARSARRRADRRLLNTALKLNDWAFPAHRKLRFEPRAARYLLALAEQERSVRELLS